MVDNVAGPGKGPDVLAGKPPVEGNNKDQAAQAAPPSAGDGEKPSPDKPGGFHQDNNLGDIKSETTTIQQAARIISIEQFTINMGQMRVLKDSVRGSKRKKGWRGIPTPSQSADPLISTYEQGIQAPPDPAFAPPSDTVPREPGSTELPEDLEVIRQWYIKNFSTFERCFIQAAAVLSGATVHEIRRATVALYKPHRDAEQRQLAFQHQIDAEDVALPTYLEIILDKEFQNRTYTVIREQDGGRRLFWQDAQSNGFSPFAIRVLAIIEEQQPIGGPIDQSFLDLLEQLPKQLEGESAWRIPRALGALWFTLDRDRLFQVATTWLTNRSPDDWWIWRTANLLFGAFEVESRQLAEQAQSSSEIIELLEEWIDHAHSSWRDQLGIQIGRTVTETCILLAQIDLKNALACLDRLLGYPVLEGGRPTISEDVFTSIVMSFVTLARFGFTREVLEHLASKAKYYVNRRLSKKGVYHIPQSRYNEIMGQRMAGISAILQAFTLLVLLSESSEMTHDQKIGANSYSRSDVLPERPAIPAEEKKDILLAGVLSTGEQKWREHITLLFSALLVEENIEGVFYLLREWVETVLRMRGPEVLKIRGICVQFIADIVLSAEKWVQELRDGGDRARPTLHPCCVCLEQWQRESQSQPGPLGAFVTDVLRSIAKQSALPLSEKRR